MKIKETRKFTGTCEYKFIVGDSYKPLLRNCGKPARFYKPEEVGMFGFYACDDCMKIRYPGDNMT